MNRPLRLIYDADARPPRGGATTLSTVDELEAYLRPLLRDGFDGEVTVHGHDTARICLYEGKIPWIRSHAYPEHLGDVLRRELGLPDRELRRVMAHCRATGQRLGEGMVGLGLVQPPELRECLWRHVSDQLSELLVWPGAVRVEANGWPHRYDHAFTFELDELLRRPSAPTPEEQRRLQALVQRCRERLPGLVLACVVEREEGTPLGMLGPDDAAAHDLLGLCLVGVRHLATHRVTRRDGPPHGIVLSASDACVVVQQLPRHPEWLLVLGGSAPAGRMLSVAQAAVRE